MASPKSKSPRKVVITCAVTGAIHTPTMSPHLPITADEIAEAAIGAHEAGAAIVHLHARLQSGATAPARRDRPGWITPTTAGAHIGARCRLQDDLRLPDPQGRTHARRVTPAR